MAGFHPSAILKAGRTDYLWDLDLTNDELYYLLDLATAVKQSPREYGQAMAGKSIAMLFEKPSLRTKLTFELAMTQMGGASIFMEGPIGVREPLKDVARNLDRWCNAIVARVFAQTTVEGLAQWSSVPVINALSDAFHPCQALADVLTIRQRFGELKGLKLSFIGDGNNVAQSLMLTAVRLGMDFALGCPPGYARSRYRVTGGRPGGHLRRVDPDYPRSRRGDGGGACRVHRCVGEHGAGAGSRQAEESVPCVPGE